MIKNWPTFLQDNSRHPETVAEAVERLMLILDGEQKIAIASMQEEDLSNLHFSLGKTIRNAFGLLESGSKLLESCNSNVDPDRASALIVKVLWNTLVGAKGSV